MLRIEPGTVGCEASMLPLCNAAPKDLISLLITKYAVNPLPNSLIN